MLSNFSTIFLKLNNITSTKSKLVNVNTTLCIVPCFKKNMNNYIALSNQKSFEIYSKYNTNTFPKFSILDIDKNNININKIIKTNAWKKYINHACFLIGCYYLFLASFSQNINLRVV